MEREKVRKLVGITSLAIGMVVFLFMSIYSLRTSPNSINHPFAWWVITLWLCLSFMNKVEMTFHPPVTPWFSIIALVFFLLITIPTLLVIKITEPPLSLTWWGYYLLVIIVIGWPATDVWEFLYHLRRK